MLRVLQFTLLQAGLSTLLSLILGLALARALARQDFPGRALVLRLLNLPLALPAIVVIIGIVGVYGSSGWLGGAVALYGLQGILLAHVFFNAPLAARLLLGELERIPAESWKLAAQLQFRDIDVFRLVEWPQLRAALPGVALLIFLLCAASFAVVLTLGGGPRATTLEVAIYQSLRADFDPQRAAALAMVQLALCAALALLAQRFGGLMPGLPAPGRRPPRFDGQARIGRSADIAVIAMGLLLLLPPLTSLVASGLANITASPALLRRLNNQPCHRHRRGICGLRLCLGAGQRRGPLFDVEQNRAACRARGLDRSAGRAGHRLVHRAARRGEFHGACRRAGHRHECADGPALRLPNSRTRHGRGGAAP